MMTSELKSKLIDKIMKVNDDHLLLEATRLIEDFDAPDNEKPFVFTSKQKEKVTKALKQVEDGDYLTSEDAENEIDLWLDK